MQRKNRSPGIVGAAVVLGIMISLSALAADDGGTGSLPDRPTDTGVLVSPSGLEAQGAFADRKTTAGSCDRSKKVVALGPSFVSRAAVKTLTPDCYTCCAEFVFVDDFESGNLSRWSVVVN